MRTFIVTIPFSIARRVYSSILSISFNEGDTICVYPATNLSDSEGKFWVDEWITADGESTVYDDCYGHIIESSDLEVCCMEEV